LVKVILSDVRIISVLEHYGGSVGDVTGYSFPVKLKLFHAFDYLKVLIIGEFGTIGVDFSVSILLVLPLQELGIDPLLIDSFGHLLPVMFTFFNHLDNLVRESEPWLLESRSRVLGLSMAYW